MTPADPIVVTPAAAIIAVGELIQAQASVDRVTWSSSTPAIASVDARGLVTGRSAGQATITARKRNQRGAMQLTIRNRLDTSNQALYGPQTGVTQPVGSVSVSPGASTIHAAVSANPVNTTFWLMAGTYAITGAITPKSGQTFVGEYGAILDGTNWSTVDTNVGAFMAHLQDIDDVTIRNLSIQNMPMRGVHGYPTGGADRWLIEYCEIAHGGRGGIMVGNNFIVRHNSFHHNAYAAYESTGGAGDTTYDTLFEDNEISYNGDQQKILFANGVIFRRNFVHHNLGHGIWYDGENVNSLIEDNVVEDNTSDGIFYEVSGSAIIRRNVVRRNGGVGIDISCSQDVESYANTLVDNFRGIQYQVDVSRVGLGGETPWSVIFDLKNNTTHDNTVRIGSQSGALLNTLFVINGSSTPYINGSKNLVFQGNAYAAPNTTGAWFDWDDATKTWTQWQALGNDSTGSIGT